MATKRSNYGKIVSKTSVEVNLSGITAKARKSVRIPEGDYLAKVVLAETFTAKSGNDGIKWAFEVSEGKFKGAGPFYNNTMLQEESLWAVRGTLQAMKPAVKIPDSGMKLDLKKYLGKTVAITLVDDEYEGRMRSAIDDVFNPDLLESEEDEEDEDVDDEEVDEDEAEEEEDDGEEEEDEVEEEEDEGDEEEEELLTQEDLDAMTIKQLRSVADDFDLDHEGVKKAGLIAGILEAQSGTEDEEDEDEEELDDEEYEE